MINIQVGQPSSEQESLGKKNKSKSTIVPGVTLVGAIEKEMEVQISPRRGISPRSENSDDAGSDMRSKSAPRTKRNLSNDETADEAEEDYSSPSPNRRRKRTRSPREREGKEGKKNSSSKDSHSPRGEQKKTPKTPRDKDSSD